ncbi:MAG: hypothetical protein LIR50_06835 [Bacillota bacterium]|nr:hypothetical protein [Bacillota bacterium]
MISYYGADINLVNGTVDYSNYPFSIVSDMIVTETSGTYTIKIEIPEKTATITEDFELAVLEAHPFDLSDRMKKGTGFHSIIENSILNNIASGDNSHTEGYSNTASGSNSHAEG